MVRQNAFDGRTRAYPIDGPRYRASANGHGDILRRFASCNQISCFEAFMKYSTFEELPVWNAAIPFALKVFELTEKADFRGLGDTKNQLERASLSISNNIAEGFERGTTMEIINFLYIARGSAGESRSMLRLCEGLDRFSNFKFDRFGDQYFKTTAWLDRFS